MPSRQLFEDNLEGPGLSVDVRREFLEAATADALLAQLLVDVPWRQDEIFMFGTRSPVPRLSAWFGAPGLTYSYSGIDLEPDPLLPALDDLRELVTDVCAAGVNFNSVLANRYRTGADSVAWHADDEPELGREPTIASVSLGATRRFQLRRKDDPTVKVETPLHHGDLLIMSGPTQSLWHHQVPKTATPVGERVNLTFRRVRPARQSPSSSEAREDRPQPGPR